MFEKYDIDELYTCTIKEYGPFAIENVGGKLYVLDTESLIKYLECFLIQKMDSKTLQCMPFGKRWLLKNKVLICLFFVY